MAREKKNIKFVKLNNGEDLIAEISTENELEYMFIHPMKIIVDTDLESSKQIIFLHPWLPTGVVQQKGIQLHASVIFLITDVQDDVREYYTNMVTEVEMSETLKSKQKQKKRKTKSVSETPVMEDNVLNFSDLLDRLKKDKPIH